MAKIRGNTQILAGSISGNEVAANAIVGSHISAGAVVGSHIAGSNIVGSHIAASVLVGSHVAASVLVGSHVAASTLVGSHIAASTLVGSHVAASTLVGSHLAASIVAGSHLVADGIVDSHVNSAAAIAYSKLLLSGLIQASDLAAGAGGMQMYPEVPAGTVDGTNAVYTVASTPNGYRLFPILNGVMLERAAAATDNTTDDLYFMASTGALLFTTGVAPTVGDSLQAWVFA